MRVASIGCAAVIGLLLIAWLLPPLLDWNRYRGAIAGFAAAELGRPLSIGGNVTLRLLPAAVLTADDVTFPDQGDGVSARLQAMRLEVAIGPLVRGRLVVRDLTLSGPALTLPWPLPANLGSPVRPYVRHPFTARVEQGSLHMGAVAVTGIDAALTSDAATGALGILGSAALAGTPLRFTTSLGAPDENGSASLTLTIDGERTRAGTGGQFAGRLSAGVLKGEVSGHGGDLAQLMPAPRGAWQLSGTLNAAAGQIALPRLELRQADTSLRAHALLRITGHAGLELGVAADRLDLAGWAGALRDARAPGLPTRLTLDVAEAPALGNRLRDLHAVLTLDATGASIEAAHVTLPGAAGLTFNGTAGRSREGPWIDGSAALDAPNLAVTLGWLRAALPGFPVAPSGQVLRTATLAGRLHASGRTMRVSGLQGRLDDVDIKGGFGIGLPLREGGRPGLTMGVRLERLVLDDWLGLGSAWPGFDGEIFVHTPAAKFRGLALGSLDAGLGVTEAGLTLSRFVISSVGGTLNASGTLGADGSLAGVRLSAKAPDLAPLGNATARFLPLPAVLLQSGLWQGGGDLDMSLAGPPGAWKLQARADAGDLRLETEAALDAGFHVASATVTVRHPGAPRLLAALGAPDAEHWTETGSFALLVHLSGDRSHVRVRDFDLTAASLRASGALDLDLAASPARVDGSIVAPALALPWRSSLPAAWLRGWDGHLHVRAEQVLADLLPVTSGLETDIILQSGALLAGPLTSSAGGGRIHGVIAADTAAPGRVAAQLDFADATLPEALTGLPIDVGGGTAAGTLDVAATGPDAAAWETSGTGFFTADISGAQLIGLDPSGLAHVGTAKPQAAKKLLQDAYMPGPLPGFSGTFAGEIGHGVVTLAPMTLTGSAQAMQVSGTLALDQSAADIALSINPSLSLRIQGPWNGAHIDPVFIKPLAPAVRRATGKRPPRRH